MQSLKALPPLHDSCEIGISQEIESQQVASVTAMEPSCHPGLKFTPRWNDPEFQWRKEANQYYNDQWINRYNLHRDERDLARLNIEGMDVSDSQHFQIGWLRNIDRLIDMTPPKFNPFYFRLLDVGCGSGISTIYFAENYRFKTYSGFDFSEELISTSRKNLLQFSTLRQEQIPITFFVDDARSHKLIAQPSFVYMFNPFGFRTADLFIRNNLQTLRSTGSILAIAEDTWITELSAAGLHKGIIRKSSYNLSLVFY